MQKSRLRHINPGNPRCLHWEHMQGFDFSKLPPNFKASSLGHQDFKSLQNSSGHHFLNAPNQQPILNLQQPFSNPTSLAKLSKPINLSLASQTQLGHSFLQPLGAFIPLIPFPKSFKPYWGIPFPKPTGAFIPPTPFIPGYFPKLSRSFIQRKTHCPKFNQTLKPRHLWANQVSYAPKSFLQCPKRKTNHDFVA